MNNIFLSDKISSLLHHYIPVSSGLSDEQILPSLCSAFDLFLVPLLGQKLAEKIIQMQNTADDDPKMAVVDTCRRAVANLAFWFNYTELNVRITDQGFQRQESDTFKSLYKYQEDELKQRFKNKGFNALDSLLSLLEQNKESFPEYASSPAYTSREQELVRSAAEIDRIYFVNRSHLIYLRLLPIFRNTMMTVLPGVIGQSLFAKVQASLSGKVPEGFDFESLRLQILPFLVLRSIYDLIESTGSLTDRGLYYSSILATSGGTVQTEPVDPEQRAQQLNQINNTAQAYRQQLVAYLKIHHPDDFSGNPSGLFQRDNDHKRTFFA